MSKQHSTVFSSMHMVQVSENRLSPVVTYFTPSPGTDSESLHSKQMQKKKGKKKKVKNKFERRKTYDCNQLFKNGFLAKTSNFKQVTHISTGAHKTYISWLHIYSYVHITETSIFVCDILSTKTAKNKKFDLLTNNTNHLSYLVH